MTVTQFLSAVILCTAVEYWLQGIKRKYNYIKNIILCKIQKTIIHKRVEIKNISNIKKFTIPNEQ